MCRIEYDAPSCCLRKRAAERMNMKSRKLGFSKLGRTRICAGGIPSKKLHQTLPIDSLGAPDDADNFAKPDPDHYINRNFLEDGARIGVSMLQRFR